MYLWAQIQNVSLEDSRADFFVMLNVNSYDLIIDIEKLSLLWKRQFLWEKYLTGKFCQTRNSVLLGIDHMIDALGLLVNAQVFSS